MAKRALLVGINDYAPVGLGGSDLEGCVNDVRDMADTLASLGFAGPGMRTVTDADATSAGIRDGLGWLVGGASPGDALVFYYSGHGSQVVDSDGDEEDRKDEILCPHDTDFPSKVWLADDDLHRIFAAVPQGVLIEVILDSCHSGTGMREPLFSSLAAGLVRDRYLSPPEALLPQTVARPGAWGRDLIRSGGGGDDRVLWSACRDDQTSQETVIDGRVRGIFTYHFCRVLRGSMGAMSRRELGRIVQESVRRGGYAQLPQLECAGPRLDGPPFR